MLEMTRLLYSPWPKSFHTSSEALRSQLYVFAVKLRKVILLTNQGCDPHEENQIGTNLCFVF
ncbi:hypothetical protein GH733_006589, partial [Mirounga leonina]